MTILNIAARTEQTHGSGEQIEISTLADKTGFPAEFIKEELLLSDDSVDINKLRELMLDYLQATMA
ncbi:MAG: hypothetical protein KAG61_05335 [Bacteriovoracaceae bacterium]|nr:hypothetical protein [Bacteriovoracaceae bacterium]